MFTSGSYPVYLVRTKRLLPVTKILKLLIFTFERIDFGRDVHFYTNSTIDTLDYSGTGLNSGSKVVFAAYGEKIRELSAEIPETLRNLPGIKNIIPPTG